MATAPPPYSPRDARRQARDMRRMQKQQYRAQYAFTRRRSFVGPVILIAAGVIALLLETGKLRADVFWPWYAQWWPLLLIAVGLGLLIEYFFDRKSPTSGRRSLGGVVWLIILLSILGGLGRSAVHLDAFGDALDNFGDHQGWMSMMGEEHVENHTLIRPIAANGTLSIVNARGDVEVSSLQPLAGGATEVHVEARQVVHASSDAAARRDLDATLPVLSADGTGASLSAGGREGASVDLKVSVPPGVTVTLRTAHGDVALSGLGRDADITLSHGDLTADSLGGSLHARMDHGDVTVHTIAGDLTVDGKADDVSVSGVKGRSLLNGEFFGDTRLANVGSQVHFHSSRTDLDVPKLAGEMALDSGNLRLVGPSGGLRLSTRSKDIEITDLVGDAHIDDSNGDMNVSAAMPLGNLSLAGRTGSMTLTLPANASFSVRGSTGDDDEVATDFALPVETSGGRKVVTGQVGQGGPHLDLEANHGDLTVHRGGARAEQPDRAETPERPEAPEKGTPGSPSARHLHSKGAEPEPSVQ